MSWRSLCFSDGSRTLRSCSLLVATTLLTVMAPNTANTASAAEAPPATAGCIAVINAERVAAGLRPLREHNLLDSVAISHSQYQARHNTMSHRGERGIRGGQRLLNAGYRWRVWGENVAAGYRTCERVVRAWMRSPSHRANILHRNVQRIGIGIAISESGRMYWTMMIAKPG